MDSVVGMACSECERLSKFYENLIQEYADLFIDYHAALKRRQPDRINDLKTAVESGKQFRRFMREQLKAHQATHDGHIPESKGERKSPDI